MFISSLVLATIYACSYAPNVPSSMMVYIYNTVLYFYTVQVSHILFSIISRVLNGYCNALWYVKLAWECESTKIGHHNWGGSVMYIMRSLSLIFFIYVCWLSTVVCLTNFFSHITFESYCTIVVPVGRIVH